jgi:hypothetical protein
MWLGNLEPMKVRILANSGCWLLIVPLMVAVMLYSFLLWHLRGSYSDGNGYTDPIAMILSYLTPIAVVGVIGLCILWRYGFATKRRVIIAMVISFCFTLAPLIFGLWLWHQWNVHFDLSYWAWWL